MPGNFPIEQRLPIMPVSLQHDSAAEKVESEKEISKPLDWPSNPIKPCRVDFVHSSFIDMPPPPFFSSVQRIVLFFGAEFLDVAFFRRPISCRFSAEDGSRSSICRPMNSIDSPLVGSLTLRVYFQFLFFFFFFLDRLKYFHTSHFILPL